ncbi:MAG TPA: tetratricopeptide repeat protein [Gemmatimonadaceae bacterium]|nr:tetratricopeptide repeat protein [Gemmatimonadaceae bacterium]
MPLDTSDLARHGARLLPGRRVSGLLVVALAGRRRWLPLLLLAAVALPGCDRGSSRRAAATLPDEPSPPFRNVEAPTEYVGDAACTTCHAPEAEAYQQHAMARSFHRWTRATRLETPLDTALYHARSGLSYAVVEVDGRPYQVEFVTGPGGKRLHELRRRMDYVMGSGHVARTYFTEENGRLFQLPLTWYRQHGWDFSPGYEASNARFDRLMPDRCIACHSSYPRPLPYLEGKYAELRPGIGCERCHGPGALHVQERRTSAPRDSAYDNTIVNPARLPLARRMDVCEQCHVHTAVAVLREGRDAFSYLPSQPLRDQWAFFKEAGSIDIVSHADRLRQSACFLGARSTSRPLECATCHDPHLPPPDALARNQPCQSCHVPALLQQRLARSASRADHAPGADCASCHMPRVQERAVPHGTFTDHWIRVVTPGSAQPTVPRQGDDPITPFFERDRTGPEARVYQRMGEIVYATLNNRGRTLGEAATALDRTLGKDSTRGEARFLVGVAYQQLGKTADAVRALEQAVRIDSNRPDRLHALARAYRSAGRAPAAVGHLYERALALQPALAWIRADYADVLQAQGRRAEAMAAYRQVLAEQPSLAVGWFNLGTLLAEEGRLGESSDAFQRAVHLDPLLGQALASLLEIRTTGDVVTGVRGLGSPLASLPVRERGPSAARLSVSTGTATPSVLFLNLPARGVVQIVKPDGTPVRALPTGEGGAMTWDLRTDAGVPIAGGLYRARVVGRDDSGRPLPPQLLHFGIVRRRAESLGS